MSNNISLGDNTVETIIAIYIAICMYWFVMMIKKFSEYRFPDDVTHGNIIGAVLYLPATIVIVIMMFWIFVYVFIYDIIGGWIKDKPFKEKK